MPPGQKSPVKMETNGKEEKGAPPNTSKPSPKAERKMKEAEVSKEKSTVKEAPAKVSGDQNQEKNQVPVNGDAVSNQASPTKPQVNNKEKSDKKDSPPGDKTKPQKDSEAKPTSSSQNPKKNTTKPSSPTSPTKMQNGNGSNDSTKNSPTNDRKSTDATVSKDANSTTSTEKKTKSDEKETKPDNEPANDSKKQPANEAPKSNGNKDVAITSSKESEKKTDDSTKTEEKSAANNDKAEKTEEKKSEEKKTKGDGVHESKNKLRKEVWTNMFRSTALAFSKPCNYRIPHFKGDVVSAGRLSTLEAFQKAKIVKVSLDKALESVRLQIVEAGKDMLVGCPGLREAVFLHVKPPMEPSKSSNKLASSRIGIGHVGTALDFSSGVQADLVIVGSVAVDKTGMRVGKGEGFADLEYALLKKLGGIAPDAPVVTVVHDSQVYDKLDENLYREHDVSADWIVTPTQIIEVNPKRKQPDLLWKLLSNRRVNSIPIVKQLLDREKQKEGNEITLKEVDTDSEELDEIAKRKRYFMRRRSYSTGGQNRRVQQMMFNRNMNNAGGNGLERRRRHTAPSNFLYQHRPNYAMPPHFAYRPPRFNYNYPRQNMNENAYWMQNRFQADGRRRNRYQEFRPKYKVDFSLKVEGITDGIRVRDLKTAVMERGIRPRDISWLPHKGIAFLHFAKVKKTADSEQTDVSPQDSDSVMQSLKGLTIKLENGSQADVKVEPAQAFRKQVHFNVV